MEEFRGREDLIFLMFRRVLIIVILYFSLFCNSRARAMKGIMCPCAMNGNNTISCFLSAIANACSFSVETQLSS